MKTLFAILERSCVSSWRRTFKGPLAIKGWFVKATLIVTQMLSSETAISAYLVAKKVRQLVKKFGYLFTALYLKQCSSSLQSVYGSVKHVPSLLPVQISLTCSGYPRLIPAHHRRMMRRHDATADMLVRLYLSWFSISRLVRLAPHVSRATFESIITPCKDDGRVLDIVGKMKSSFSYFIP